ncbi:terminase small subunit [Corynebacterium striatum]|uniref:terminase small subunit n=1 Tax=Corynebacterium striatum TaxID=43770 RepID=UPI001A2B8DA4|nr:hypothetical protein [Corynebacterium striatum]
MEAYSYGQLEQATARSIQRRGDQIKPEDEALVVTAMMAAQQIEVDIAAGGQQAAKAIYMIPHFKGVLADLGCTAPGRMALGGDSNKGREGKPGAVANNEIAARRAKLRGRGA